MRGIETSARVLEVPPCETNHARAVFFREDLYDNLTYFLGDGHVLYISIRIFHERTLRVSREGEGGRARSARREFYRVVRVADRFIYVTCISSSGCYFVRRCQVTRVQIFFREQRSATNSRAVGQVFDIVFSLER